MVLNIRLLLIPIIVRRSFVTNLLLACTKDNNPKLAHAECLEVTSTLLSLQTYRVHNHVHERSESQLFFLAIYFALLALNWALKTTKLR